MNIFIPLSLCKSSSRGYSKRWKGWAVGHTRFPSQSPHLFKRAVPVYTPTRTLRHHSPLHIVTENRREYFTLANLMGTKYLIIAFICSSLGTSQVEYLVAQTYYFCKLQIKLYLFFSVYFLGYSWNCDRNYFTTSARPQNHPSSSGATFHL